VRPPATLGKQFGDLALVNRMDRSAAGRHDVERFMTPQATAATLLEGVAQLVAGDAFNGDGEMPPLEEVCAGAAAFGSSSGSCRYGAGRRQIGEWRLAIDVLRSGVLRLLDDSAGGELISAPDERC
jgi:hypothetical protein